jgi:hypothetical protein
MNLMPALLLKTKINNYITQEGWQMQQNSSIFRREIVQEEILKNVAHKKKDHSSPGKATSGLGKQQNYFFFFGAGFALGAAFALPQGLHAIDNPLFKRI